MWKTVQLGDLCEILDTRRKPITKKDRIHGEYPYYGATGIVDWVADYIFDEELVLIGEDGAKWDAGEKTAFIVDGKYWVNNHAHVVKPNTEKLLNKWLTYYLCGIDLKPWVTGMTVPKLNQGQLKSIPIPLPPLAEQERIVAKLDAAFAEIDEAVSLAQYKIADIQSLKNALLGSNLSNTKTTEKLGDVIEIARGGSPRPIKSFITTEDDGVNWIKIGDTKQGGKYISTTKEKIKPSGVSRSRYVKENDFLLSNSMSFGRPYILKTTGCIHDGWLVLSKYQESFIADYLYYLLSSSLVQNQFESLARGSTVRNLNIELVSQVIVPILPLTEQQRVVAKLDVAYSALEMANDAMEKSKRNYQALKSAILSKELQSSEAA